MPTRLDWILLARPLALESVNQGEYHIHVPLRTGVVPHHPRSSQLGCRPQYTPRRRYHFSRQFVWWAEAAVRLTYYRLLTRRVALARAVYGKFDTYILDDVMSALDATTEAHVFAALFGFRGLLKDKTVIMATNQVYRLPQASYVTCLDNGRIAEQGEYNALLQKGGILTDLVAEFSSGEKAEKVAEAEAVPDALTEDMVETKSDKEEEGELSAKGEVAWSSYLIYLRAMGATNAGIWFSMTVVAAAIETTISIYLQAWTTRLSPTSSPGMYGNFLGGYAGMQLGFLFAFCIAIVNAFMYAHPIVSKNLHEWQVKGMLGYVFDVRHRLTFRASLDFFDSRPVGQMINRFNSDLNMSGYITHVKC
jgi:ATP-binding cassette subfamily C (CFTR/MRP) protein 1